MSFQDYQGGPGYQPTNGSATAALVLGICGFVICPLIPSVLAIVYGKKARHEIAASGGRQTGGSQATAGIVLGWIGIGLCVLLGLLLILALAVFSIGVSELEAS
jgi:hypothetical protein